MKIRSDFVTNSSSSSFIVIDASKGYDTLDGEEYNVGQRGETEFGWGPEDIHGIDSRINFAYLQALYKNEEWTKMIGEVITENSEVKKVNFLLTLEWKSDGNTYGYIDHQSNAAEGENTEMFDSKEELKDWIFGSGSYIHLDNDNH